MNLSHQPEASAPAAPVIPASCRDSHEASLKYVEGFTNGHDAGWASAMAHAAALATPPAPLGEDALPVVAYRQFSDFGGWHTYPNVFAPDGKHSENQELTPLDDAEAQLTTLRNQVARLEKVMQERALQALSDNGQWIEETGRLHAEIESIKASKAAPLDVEAVMRLADAMASAKGEFGCTLAKQELDNFHAAREALRSKLTAKE